MAPDTDCPTLYSEVRGSGTGELSQQHGPLFMNVYHQAGPMSGVYGVMLLGAPGTKMKGRKQQSHVCIEPECLCRVYSDYEKTVAVARVALRVQRGAQGQMVGQRSWQSSECAMNESVGFAVNEALGMSDFDPPTPGGDPSCTTRLEVSWRFVPVEKSVPPSSP